MIWSSGESPPFKETYLGGNSTDGTKIGEGARDRTQGPPWKSLCYPFWCYRNRKLSCVQQVDRTTAFSIKSFAEGWSKTTSVNSLRASDWNFFVDELAHFVAGPNRMLNLQTHCRNSGDDLVMEELGFS